MTKKHKEGKLANKKELDKRIKLLFLDKKNFYPEQKMEEKKLRKLQNASSPDIYCSRRKLQLTEISDGLIFLGPTHSSGCHRGLDLIIDVEYSH